MLTLFVTGLEFYGYHGVPPEERVVGHRYVVDLELDVTSDAEHSDEVADTVDYARAALLVQEVAAQEQCKTVERLAYKMAIALLAEQPRISRVSVRLAKRLPPAPIIAEELGVEIELMRDRKAK